MDIRYNMDAFRAIRHDPAVKVILDRAAERVAAEAGEGYETGSWSAGPRYRASVITATPRAMNDNAKNNTLARAMNAL